ncbi:conserved hypothetical protein [Cupriavidus taiwanensis]|nr:conserved hypothetical protein [Cupriavidus taiwanensis]
MGLPGAPGIPKSGDVVFPRRMPLARRTKKKTRAAVAVAGFWSCWYCIGLNTGGAGGNRTRVRKPSTESSTYLVLSFDLTGASRTNTLYDGESLGFRPRLRDPSGAYLT